MSGPPLVLHTKFAAYLGWSQPFLHRLVVGLEPRAPGAVLCNRRENRERFPLERWACASTQSLLRPSGAALLAEALREAWHPRLVHAHFGWSGVRSLLLRQCLDVPLVTTFGGRDLGADLEDPVQRPLYAWLLQASDRCICVSDALAAVLAERGVEEARIHVVRRGADASFFAPVARERPDGEPLRLLMVGRLVEKKGHADALAALAALRDAGRACVLRVVGAGDADAIRAEAERLRVGGRLEIEAPTDADGVRAHFAWADLLVHCSRRATDGDVEGIPNVVVEAAATGLPTVGTRHGGIPEVVRDGETGRLVPEADAKALASALEALAAEPGTRRALGEAAARWVRAHATLDAQLDAHVALYAELEGVRPRAAPLGPGFTHAALAALRPAVDADLLVASRWVSRSAGRASVDAPPRAHRAAVGVSGAARPAAPPNTATDPAREGSAERPEGWRERLRRFGAAWAERPMLGLPMRAYRALRRTWVSAAQRREDARGWRVLERGPRPDLHAAGAARALRAILREGPTG